MDATGNATYSAWFEWWRENPSLYSAQFPYVDPIVLPFYVLPGDSIQVAVTLNQPGVPPTGGGVFFANLSRIALYPQPPLYGSLPMSFSLDVPTQANAAGNCAEWIVERPRMPDGSYATLPNFVVVTFSSAFAKPRSAISQPTWATVRSHARYSLQCLKCREDNPQRSLPLSDGDSRQQQHVHGRSLGAATAAAPCGLKRLLEPHCKKLGPAST